MLEAEQVGNDQIAGAMATGLDEPTMVRRFIFRRCIFAVTHRICANSTVVPLALDVH